MPSSPQEMLAIIAIIVFVIINWSLHVDGHTLQIDKNHSSQCFQSLIFLLNVWRPLHNEANCIKLMRKWLKHLYRWCWDFRNEFLYNSETCYTENLSIVLHGFIVFSTFGLRAGLYFPASSALLVEYFTSQFGLP